MVALISAIALGSLSAATARASLATPTQWLAKISTEAQGRSPSPGAWSQGAAYYGPARDCNAQTLAALGREAYTAPEFLALGYDDAAKLLSLYRGALNREPGQAELSALLSTLNNEGARWRGVVDGVFDSAEFASLASAICDPADPNYSFSPKPPGDLRQWAGGATSRTQAQLQIALDTAGASCGTVELAPMEVVPIGGQQPGEGPDDDPLRIPPCVTLTTAGRPDRSRYADMGRLVPNGLVCDSPRCIHGELVRLADGARLESVWVDGRGADPRNLELALVGAQSGQRATEIVNNRVSDPPPGGAAVRLDGYGTSATPCGGRLVSENLITGYATRHGSSRFGTPLWADGIAVFCEQASVRDNELVDISDRGIVVHGVWNAATEERRTQRSTVSRNRILSAGVSARVALGADAVGECLADGEGPPVDCIEFSHDRGGAPAERSFAGTSIADNTFSTAATTHFDIALMVGGKAIWGDNGPLARGVSFTGNTTAGVDTTRVNTGIAVSGMFETDLRGNTSSFDLVDTNPALSEGKCPRGDVLYAPSLAGFSAGSQPASAVSGLDGCLADHPPPGGMERIELGPGRTFLGEASGERFIPWGNGQGIDHKVDVFDLREIRQMGSNVVRIHLQFKDIMASCTAADPAALDELGDTLRRAEENGIYLDVTGLSSYWGDAQDPACYRNANQQERWAAQEAFWRAVAQRVAPSPAVFALDIANEPIVPLGSTPCWSGPAPPNRPGAPFCPPGFAGYFFNLNITRAPGGPPSEIGRAWVTRMRDAIRAHDSRHLITLGCLPAARCVGLNATEMAALVDYLSVHIYPRDCTGAPLPALDPCGGGERSVERSAGNPLAYERALLAAYASGGDPVVVEETFPLVGSPELVRQFILASRPYATGWIGQWEDLTMSQERATAASFPYLRYFWGRVFQRLTGNLYVADPGESAEKAAASSGNVIDQGNRGVQPVGGRSAGAPRAIADRTRPRLRSLTVSPRRLAVRRRAPEADRSRGKRRGTVRYRLSERASVRFVIERRRAGRRVGGRCRAAVRKGRRATRCFRYERVRRFTARGRLGRNRTPFPARLSRTRALRPGRYRVVARAVDPSGNRSGRARARFRVVTPR